MEYEQQGGQGGEMDPWISREPRTIDVDSDSSSDHDPLEEAVRVPLMGETIGNGSGIMVEHG